MPRPTTSSATTCGGRPARQGHRRIHGSDPAQARPRRGYSALVLALTEQGKLDEVVAAYREAIRLKPDNVEGHLHLGGILRARGDTAGSLVMLRRGHELGSKQPGWPRPSAEWVADAERQAGLAQRLTAVLKGEASPKDNAERLALVRMCQETNGSPPPPGSRPRPWRATPSSARISEPPTAITPPACRPGRCRSGVRTTHAPTQAARDRFRTQARDWFRADLGLCSKILDTGNAKDRVVVVQALQHWKVVQEPGRHPRRRGPGQAPRARAEGMAIALGRRRRPARAGQGHPAKTVATASPMPAKAPNRPQTPPQRVNTLLGDLRRAGNGPLADQLTQEIQQAQAQFELYRKRDPQSPGT